MNGIDPTGRLYEWIDVLEIAVPLVGFLRLVFVAPVRRNAQKQADIVKGKNHPLGTQISRVFRELKRMQTPIPTPILQAAPATTWSTIEEEIFQGLGSGLWKFYDLKKKKPNALDPIPYTQKAFASTHTTCFIHTGDTNVVYHVYPMRPDGNPNATLPKLDYPWLAALAHELMHVYRNITGQRTDNKATEEFQTANPIGEAIRLQP